jgi:hypothetical protein
MSQLYNSICSIYRDVLEEDQFGGRVVTTGTLIAQAEPCRLDYYQNTQKISANQGMETDRSYSLYLRSTRQHPINIRENDYVVITFPPYHPELGVRLRVRGIQRESLSHNSQASMIECSLVRVKESRDNTVF